MPTYRKKPVKVEAFTMTRACENRRTDWPEWLREAQATGVLYTGDDGLFRIKTLEGDHTVSWGDVIIQGVEGELYPCKPGIFAKTYEPDWSTGRFR